jgi:acyl carrier protein
MSTKGAAEAATAGLADFAEFVELLAARMSRPLDGAAPDDRLTDLGLDSIAMLELFVLLEEAAVHDLPIDLVDSLETLGDVWHWHATLSASSGNGAEPPDSTASHPGQD